MADTGPATTQGRDYALKMLAERRANQPEHIDNAKLYAGSAMYFYCHYCGHLSDTLPESYTTRPSHVCGECQALVDAGWME